MYFLTVLLLHVKGSLLIEWLHKLCFLDLTLHNGLWVLIDWIVVLFYSFDTKLESFLVGGCNQEVLAEVFVAGTLGMTLTEGEYFVDRSGSPWLESNHLS